MTRREQLQWLSGWLEGEGSFHCSTLKPTLTRKAYHRLKIVGVSNDLDTLEKVQKIAGGHINGPYKYGDKRKNHYQWGVRKMNKAISLMRDLYPYMGARRKEQITSALLEVGSFV